MADTPSRMLPLGAKAPSFSLRATSGKTVSLSDFAGNEGLLVMFICNHCPFVKHIAGQLSSIGRDFSEHGIGVVAINANDTKAYPDDSFENMLKEREARGYPFPYLLDETQEVAKAYQAACTPDFFLFDRNRTLFYRGQLDDSRPGSALPVSGQALRNAAAAMLERTPAPVTQKPSVGCSIKWRPGNEPKY